MPRCLITLFHANLSYIKFSIIAKFNHLNSELLKLCVIINISIYQHIRMKEIVEDSKEQENLLSVVFEDMMIFVPDTPVLKAKSFSRMPSITEIFKSDSRV